MKYSLSSLFKTSNFNKTMTESLALENIIKPFYLQKNNLWKFFMIYELFTVLIDFFLVAAEFWINFSHFINIFFIVKVSFQLIQIIVILFIFLTHHLKYKELGFNSNFVKTFVIVNSYIDILIFCHLDQQILDTEMEDICSIFLVVKSLFFTLFFDSLVLILNLSAISVLYIIFWTYVSSNFVGFIVVKWVIYSTMIMILVGGVAYLLNKTKLKQMKKIPMKKNFKLFKFNPFLEIMPEGILLVRCDENFKLVFFNQYVFKTLEIDKFKPENIEEFSHYLVNFVRCKEKNDSKSAILRRSLKKTNNKNSSYQTYKDLHEVLNNLVMQRTTNSGDEVDEEEITEYFMANRIDPIHLDDETFQIELTIKKINYKMENYFIILMQSMKLKKIVQELREKDDFKSRLLSSFSHELKTPLNGTIPCLELLLNEDDISEELKEKYIRTSLSSLKLLQSTINDIIDYSLIVSDQMILDIKPIDMGFIISEIENLLKPLLKSKNLKMVTNIHNLNMNLIFYSDYNRITQILLNILINAIKFTNSGGSIFLKIELETKNMVDNLIFEVKDTGIGISTEELEEIRSYLHNICYSMDENFGLHINSTGCGFGLLISQNLTLLLGSDDDDNDSLGLDIDSKLNLGTIVKFVLTDKKQKFLESKSSLEKKTNKSRNSVIMDSVKIEFRRQLNLSLKRNTNKSDSLTLNSLPILSNNELDSFKFEFDVDVDTAIKTHDFNEGLKFLISFPPNNINNMIKVNTTFNYKSHYLDPFDSINECNLNRCCECEDVLIVDDDVFNLLSLEMLLNKWNLRSKKAMNGQEAVNIIKKRYLQQKPLKCCKGFKAIIMDFQMPIKDGVEATKEIINLIKENKLANIPIIGCTAFVTKQEVTKCFESGMKDVMFKPLNRLLISEIVKNWIL